MTGPGHRYESSATDVTDLLADLDKRLQRRGIAAAIFVVGGAAIAATGLRDDRITADIDAFANDQAVLEEASALARDRGLPDDWQCQTHLPVDAVFIWEYRSRGREPATPCLTL
jgi:hypothetical protein